MSCIWRFMYHDVLEPGDTFPMMMRKMVMAISGIAGIIPVLVLIQMLMGLLEMNSSSYPRFTSLVVCMIGSWSYVKRTHTAPSWLIALWTNSMSAIILTMMLSSPNGPWEFALVAIIIIVLLCKVPSLNVTAPVTALLVFGYNFSLGRASLPL